MESAIIPGGAVIALAVIHIYGLDWSCLNFM